MMEEERTSLKDEIRRLNVNIKEALEKRKPKRFKLPFKSRVGRQKQKRGYVTVQVINENKTVDFRKEPIEDGVVRLGDTYHAVEDKDLFSYKGKPFIVIPKNKSNPWNPISQRNETYGQKYIMARMEKDTVKQKSGFGSIGVILFALIVVGVIVYYIFSGGG